MQHQHAVTTLAGGSRIQDRMPVNATQARRRLVVGVARRDLRDPCKVRQMKMGAALLRRRPKGLLPAARQELLDPSKAWWGGRRGRLADRPRYFIGVSLGVVPLVLPRRGSPSTHRGRGWLRSTRSFRTASAPTQLGAALLRRRPKGLLPAARQELLDPSKAWWGGRRGRLADRPRYSISVSLGVVPRWYSRVVEVPVRIEVAAGFVAPGASEPPRLQPSWPPGGSGPAHG